MSSGSYPLYPPLSETGKLEAEKIIEWAKERLKEVCDEALGKIYVDIPQYIESDSWTNFGNAVMDGFRDYGTRHIQGKYDFKTIREKIFYQFRDEIINDLDQDNLERIAALEKRVSELREELDRAYSRRSW